MDGTKVAILKGIIIRIEADADIEDLVPMHKHQVKTNMRSLEDKLENKVKKANNEDNKKTEKRKLFSREITFRWRYEIC